MAYKKNAQSKGDWSTTIQEIRTNITQITKKIMNELNNPVYSIEYPDIGNHECPMVKANVSMDEFRKVWGDMDDDFCAVQAKMAVPLINERFQLPISIRHDLNNLTTEINRLESIMNDNKLKLILKQIDKKTEE